MLNIIEIPYKLNQDYGVDCVFVKKYFNCWIISFSFYCRFPCLCRYGQKNEVIVTGGKILSYKTTAKYRNADNCLTACKSKSSCEAYSLNSNGAYCVLYESVRSIQTKDGAFTAFKADFK